MFCVSCGSPLQETFKFCGQCGKSTVETSQQPISTSTTVSAAVPKAKVPSFGEFATNREKERASFFRSKGKGKKKVCSEETEENVTVNVGVTVFDGSELKKQRGKGLGVTVRKGASKDELLSKAVNKHLAHSRNFVHQGVRYCLLYPDGTEVDKLKETDDDFVLFKYKQECGKPYARITFFLCPAIDLTQSLLKSLDDKDTLSISDESDGEPNAKLARKTEQSAEKPQPTGVQQTLPEIFQRPDAPSSSRQDTSAASVDALSTLPGSSSGSSTTVSRVPDVTPIDTLREMFPNSQESILQGAIDLHGGDLNSAINLVLETQEDEGATPQNIYASFSFCNDISDDDEPEDLPSVLTSWDNSEFEVNAKSSEPALTTAIQNLAEQKIGKDALLRIKVRRSNIWEDTKSKMRKSTNAELSSMLKIQFVGEPAVDQGGPRNEFFSLLHRDIASSGLFTGEENKKIFSHDLIALQQRNYYMYGQL